MMAPSLSRVHQRARCSACRPWPEAHFAARVPLSAAVWGFTSGLPPAPGGLRSLGVLFATSPAGSFRLTPRPYDPALSAVSFAFVVRFFEEFVLPIEERTGRRLSTREVCSELIRSKTWSNWAEWLVGQERRMCCARRYVELVEDAQSLEEDSLGDTWAGTTGNTWPVRGRGMPLHCREVWCARVRMCFGPADDSESTARR